MTINYISTDATTLTATPQLFYTCPASTTAMFNTMTAVNLFTDRSLIDVWLVRSGGSVVESNKIHNGEVIGRTEDIYLDKIINQVLKPGDTVHIALQEVGNTTIKAGIRQIT